MITLFSISGAASFSGYSRHLIRYWVKQGIIPATRIDKTFLITAADLKQFLISRLNREFGRQAQKAIEAGGALS